MFNKTRILDLTSLSLILTITLSNTAFAYLDAGTGSQIIQIIIASSVGALFALKMYFKKIKLFFTSKFGKKSENLAEETATVENSETNNE